MCAQAAELLRRGAISDAFPSAPFSHRLALLSAEAHDPAISEELWSASMRGNPKHMKTAGMFGIVTYPPLLDVVESVCGAEILAHPQSNCRAKLPTERGLTSEAFREGQVVGWHQVRAHARPSLLLFSCTWPATSAPASAVCLTHYLLPLRSVC